jgi:hypothetical protein
MSVALRRAIASSVLAVAAVAGVRSGDGDHRARSAPAAPLVQAQAQVPPPRRLSAGPGPEREPAPVAPPLPPAPAEVIDRPPAQPLGPEALRARRAAGLLLLDEAALRVEEQLAAAERAGDEEAALRQRVRLERLARARAHQADQAR